ncbi:MAG: Rieske 2Fe-2S domain-containing protein [Acidobacteriaceae bacterium]
MHAMQPQDKPVSRMSFLRIAGKSCLAGTGLLALGMLWRFFSFKGESAPTGQVDLGPVSGFPMGSRTPVAEAQAIIIHSSQGIKVLSLVCPHLGCVVNVVTDGFTCPCHGSRYQLDGSLRGGPASRPLADLHFEITPTGHLILYNE